VSVSVEGVVVGVVPVVVNFHRHFVDMWLKSIVGVWEWSEGKHSVEKDWFTCKSIA
jgi:hypothetical protein